MKRFLITAFLVCCLLAALFAGGIVYYLKDSMNDVTGNKRPVSIVVDKGDTIITAARKLERRRIIGNPSIFGIIARFNGKTNIKAGEYLVPVGITYGKLLQMLEEGKVVNRQFTIPEGLTVYEILTRLENVKGLTGTIPFIKKEGVFLPETYSYQKGDTYQQVIARMQRDLQKTLDEAWQKRQPNLPYKNKYEALIMASIIEKETGRKSERRKVASVFVNRLNKGMKLQTDPTVIYAVTGGKGKLGRPIYKSDLALDNPYNTYKNYGLPPTPIACAGKAAIEAALNPEQTDYLYFVAEGGTGGHNFGRTLAEHNANVKLYRAWERSR